MKINIWDLNSNKLIKTLKGHSNTVKCLYFNENMIISGSEDRTIRIWDTEKVY